MVYLRFVDSYKDFCSVVQITKVNGASSNPLNFLQKQSKAHQGTLSRRRWSRQSTLQTYSNFSKLVLPFAINCCDSHQLENCPECVPPNNPQYLLSVHVTIGFRKKIFWSSFLGKIYRQNTVFWKIFCFQIRISLISIQLSLFVTLLLSDGIC